ncbi:DgyrCDS11874 [Dimorphilus gyrociliatus]|uniref:DgyrCDS11874 n=1 Tax=Dimorphilus gyrociliatus TaxID=2664684 RepID=A0A7I8W5U4_9ANNE|nr:DgyrCDS11874 [Dimorphilus gyrociliatus]
MSDPKKILFKMSDLELNGLSGLTVPPAPRFINPYPDSEESRDKKEVEHREHENRMHILRQRAKELESTEWQYRNIGKG